MVILYRGLASGSGDCKEEQYNSIDTESMIRKYAQPEGSHITLLQITTFCSQQKELEHKGG